MPEYRLQLPYQNLFRIGQKDTSAEIGMSRLDSSEAEPERVSSLLHPPSTALGLLTMYVVQDRPLFLYSNSIF